MGRLEAGFTCDRVPSRGRTLGIVPTQADASEGGLESSAALEQDETEIGRVAR